MNPTLDKNNVPINPRVAQINAQIASQGNKGYSVAPNTTDSKGNLLTPQVPTTINSSMLSSNVAPINLPTPTPPSTAGAGLSGEVTAKITNDYNNLTNELKTAQDQAKQQVSETKQGLLQQLGLKSQAVEDKMAAYQTPEFLAKQKAVNDAYSEVQKLDAAQRSELEALNAQGLTGAGSQAAQAGISRKYSLARANLAVVYDVANRDYQSAVENIDRAAALKQEAVQPYIDYYSKILDGDLSAFTKAEQNTLQLRLSEYQRKQEDISQVGEILKTAVANGVQLSSQDVAKINSFENPNDALGYLASKGISLQDPLDRQIKREQILTERAQRSKLDAETAKVISESIPQTTKQETEALVTINDINNILSGEDFDKIFGLQNALTRNIAGTPAYVGKQQVNNLINKLALAARGQLKGQGAVSDFEGRMLKEAQTALTLNLQPDQARKELAKVRGALSTSSGGKALVKITNPTTKESALVEVTQEGINQAIKDGNQIEYQ